MRPDHRAHLFNETGKQDWSISDRIMGVGLSDRQFDNIDQQHLHITLARRMQEKEANLAERVAYRPPSLKNFWDILLKKDTALSGDTPDETKDLWDSRALQAPQSVRTYVIQPNDTLGSIAEREMGNKKDYIILFLHNQKIGRLVDPDEIYAGISIEIPVYPIQLNT